jgi:hypothetical protein
MRFYDITITPPIESPEAFSAFSFSSQTTPGIDNYSALRVDLDFFQQPYHQPSSNGHVKIWGVDLNKLNNTADFNPILVNKKLQYKQIYIQIGMSKGLPFANPKQAGFAVQGSIIQAFATWQGTEVGLDLVFVPSNVNPNAQANIPAIWQKDTELTDIVTTALKTAYPNTPVTGSFSAGLKWTEPTQSQNFNLINFAQTINSMSRKMLNKTGYLGASIISNTQGFLLTDNGITATEAKQITFTDIIGSVTWIDAAMIQVKVVMRADINVGDYILFQTNTPVLNVVNNNSQARNNISFKGTFWVTRIHHMGSSRQTDGNAWVTVIDAVINTFNAG